MVPSLFQFDRFRRPEISVGLIVVIWFGRLRAQDVTEWHIEKCNEMPAPSPDWQPTRVPAVTSTVTAPDDHPGPALGTECLGGGRSSRSVPRLVRVVEDVKKGGGLVTPISQLAVPDHSNQISIS